MCGEGANSYLYSMILLSGLILSCDHLGLTSAKLARARFENIPYYYDLTSNDLPSGITFFFFWGGEGNGESTHSRFTPASYSHDTDLSNPVDSQASTSRIPRPFLPP